MEGEAASASSTNNPQLSFTQQLDLIRTVLFSWFSSSSHTRELVGQAVAFAGVGFFRAFVTLTEYVADVMWGIELFK
mgnify:CR=1 FL=1